MKTLDEFLREYPYIDENEIKMELKNRIGIYGFEGSTIYVIKYLTDNIIKYQEYHNVKIPDIRELPEDIDRGEREPDLVDFIYL